ncbi:MAG: hypothetical protein M3342_19280 [Bacteroidota bacterium]|nr:hypothetical protein [Flavisolibacter sp.]MBD0367270.1 hypothetical protein [Flavisolibacter sp.]MDQ3846125.1 hypothetical protein [Bacteroidota bacterium]
MKKYFFNGLLLLSLSSVFFTACKKERGVNEEPVLPPDVSSASKTGIHGHLQQTKTFSSEFISRASVKMQRLLPFRVYRQIRPEPILLTFFVNKET